MKKSILNKNKKALLALSLACVSAFSLCLMTACDDDNSDKDSSTTTKTDNETIANGNFEYYTVDKDLSSIISPSGWTKSVGSDANGSSASSSTKASGIVDTEVTHWYDLTCHSDLYKEGMPLKDALAAWEDGFSIYDRLAFYKDIQDGLYKDDGIEKLSDFEYYTDYIYPVGVDDIPTCENPGTHNGVVNAENDSAKDAESSVLMIQNYRSDGYGTAQKYTSSTTITVPANTSATFSVWVKTMDLTYNDGETVDGNRGAYIGVTHTLGGNTLDQMQIKNIDTSSVTENNGWEQYTVYLKGSSHASSTFTIVLGLGQGSSSYRYENVEGYAFFDDVKCETITNEEYEEAVKAGLPTCYAYDELQDKLFETDTAFANDAVFALDLYGEFDALDVKKELSLSYGLTQDDSVSGKIYTTSGENSYKGLNIETKNDVLKTGTVAELKSVNNKLLNKILSDDFAAFPFDETENVVMMMSANGAAYTTKVTETNGEFTLAPDEYRAYTFFVKTSALNGYTGASINLIDGDNVNKIAAFDSTLLSPVKTDSSDDLFDGWAQCFFFVKNETDQDRTFSLELCYGPSSIVGSTKADYLEGYAAFTRFQALEMTETEFANISTGSYAVSVSLTGKAEKEATAFDSVIYSNPDAIEEGFAIPLNYQGVAGGSYYVGGTNDVKANSSETAGLLNKKYADNYYDTDWAKTLIAAAEDSSLTAALNKDNWFGAIFGNAAQPLVILNAVEQSYGYIAGSTSNIASSSYTTVSVDVTVSKGAIAYVYLIDTSSLKKGYTSSLKIETPEVTFWYDDDGNICKKDPSADDFDEKTDIAYYITENGLYESADETDTALYANLKAFQTANEYDADEYPLGEDESKNLVTKTGAIAFYYHDGAYYAQYDAEKNSYNLKVTDIPDDFAAAYARYATQESRDLYTVIDNREGNETIHEVVTYYVSTGNSSKSYRLEVFSGNREGTIKSKAGSFVAFDSVSYSSLSNNYDALLKETIDDVVAKKEGVTLDKESGRLVKDGKTYENALYYTYTFYDSSSYVRYDKDADPANNYVVYTSSQQDPGNLYYNYQQSAYEEELIYLQDGYTTFVNFSAIDTTVSPESVDTDEDEEEDSFEWTSELFMMIASIALSVVLIFTLVVLFVKRVIKDRKKNKKVEPVPQYRSKRKTDKGESKKE